MILSDARIRFVPLAEVTELTFDHAAMSALAIAVLLDALSVNAEDICALLGTSFDTTSLMIARMKEPAAAAGYPAPGRSIPLEKMTR